MSKRLVTTCVFGLLALMAAPLHAQTRSSRSTQSGSVRNASYIEQDARASWQPVRDLSKKASAASTRTSQPRSANVRLVDHTATLPAPPMPPSIDPIIESGTISHSMPLDGQVVYDPMLDGGCDSMPMGSCGCGDHGCDGGCGSMTYGGCDGIGCGAGVCHNGDPMCGEYNDCDAMRPCVTLCWPQDGWFSAEYLLWWQDGMALPPLVSTDVLPSQRFPNDPGRVLYGGNDVLTENMDGLRLKFGFWLDKCHTWGIGAEGFGIGEETESYRASGADSQFLGRPFINVANGSVEDQQQVAFPNQLAGTVAVDVDSRLRGWGLHLRHLRRSDASCSQGLFCGCPEHTCERFEYLVGFRQVELREGVRITEDLASIPTAPDTTVLQYDIFDDFRTRNQFNGLDLGWMYKRTRGYWTFDALIRLGVGNTRQRVTIDGETSIDGGAAQAGGLLAQNSNIGEYSRDEFSVMPQLDLTVGYQITDQLRATFGYTFLYWSNVVRPGDHIDRRVDTAQLPNGTTPATPVLADYPAFEWDNTDYWAQGINFGGEYRW
ncbi:BBP7 family outer membrane beta-barrel protein [Rhodopirellula sp. JC740]|uniref:BBP7 family outer membrane beta-barrel protein n=1 Tax=Rhodopirellula halodulae TaxID=2894198 RepID=A0ABS8NJR8_9BACT|nr:BBP7 family outer membrane beta-barrel protein [Rhodopirellula sp. JC740]